ncbi:MAG: diguanylate cyclase [Desulfovibrio sp.]
MNTTQPAAFMTPAAFRESPELMQSVLDSLAQQIAVLDRQGDIVAVNASWLRFARENGVDPSSGLVTQNYLRTCDHAMGCDCEEANPSAAGIRKVLAGELPEFRLEYPCHSPREQRWFLMYVTPLLRGAGVAGAVVSHLVITDRILAETRQRESEARLNVAQRLAHVGSFERNLVSGHGEWSAELFRIFGHEPGDLAMPSPGDFLRHVHPDDREGVLALFAQGDTSGQSFQTEFRIFPDGEGRGERFVSLFCDYDRDRAGQPIRRHGAVLDITERHAAEEQLKLLANADPLTGVANRRRFMELLRAERERALRFAQPLCVVMLDLDDFKRVNDVHGHDVGDQMLRHVSALVSASLRTVDTLGRLGGEEFCLLLPQTGQEAGLEAVQRILERLRRTPLELPGGPLRQTMSCGLAALNGTEGPEPGVDELLKRADDALYRAKAKGKDRVERHE